MQVGMLYNSKSGRGKGPAIAAELEPAIRGAGHQVTCYDVAADPEKIAAAARADAVLLIGGDGSVNQFVRHLLNSPAALYHVPTGTENLFSRDWGMVRDTDTILDALKAGRTTLVDVGMADDRPFVVMASLGPDAGVVHRVQAARTGPISHATYIQPAFEELADPRLKPLSLWVDGRELVNNQPGWCVIANSSQYGARLDPVRNASPTDGQLDVFFAPADSAIEMLGWMLRARLNDHIDAPESIYARGSNIRVEAPEAPSQLDGEPFREHTGTLECTLLPRSLRLLLPTSHVISHPQG